MGIENNEEGEPQTNCGKNALSAENCGNLIVHVLDALVHGLAHGHNGIVLGVQNGLDIRCVLGVGHLQINVAGGQCIHRVAVLGEAFGGLDDLGGSSGAAGREGAGLGNGLCALFRDTPVDEVGSGLCLGRIGVDGQAGHSAQRRTSLCTSGVRILDDAPV